MIEEKHFQERITLKEEQIVQKIVAQIQNNCQFELDEQLSRMISQGQQMMQAEYQALALERMISHRQGINFQQFREEIASQNEEEAIVHEIIQEESEICIFQRQSINKSKITEKQILQMDAQFPKLNYTGMIGQQQSIFGLQMPAAVKWLTHRKIKNSMINSAMSSKINERTWILMAIKHELVVFMGKDISEPHIITQSGEVTALAVSPCKKYLAIAVQSQIIIYEIKKGTNIILLKHFNDLKVNRIHKIDFIEGGPKLYFIDERFRIGLLYLQIGMFLTKVKIDEIVHNLKIVNCYEPIKVQPKCILFAYGGDKKVHLCQIQPSILHFVTLDIPYDYILCSWRRHKQKINLIIAYKNTVIIYKLNYDAEQKSYYLQQHLKFLNHYQIEKMFVISQFHILIQSPSNFAVVGLPLIPTAFQDPDINQSEGALVFVFTKESESTVLWGVEQGILCIIKDSINIGQLKCLQAFIDELMIEKCAFRQAFSLLVLVSKGINYSFRFSYELQELKRLIHSSVQISASTILPALDKKIIQFRVGWVIQLCIQCNQQQVLWSNFYPILKQKKLQKVLFQMLQMFILKNQIKQIPEPIFLQIINYYAEKDQQLIIEKLVLANKEPYEATKLLSLLNQKEMNYLQFYLFSRGILSDQNDFYTPFLRAFTAYSRNIEQQSERKVESGMLCYLILSKSFNFEHVPFGYMTRDVKQIVVKQFFIQTLSRTFLKRLSDSNLRLFLQTYLLPFLNNEFKDIMWEQQAILNERIVDYFQFQMVAEAPFIDNFLQHIENCIGLNRNSMIFAQFYALVLYLTKSRAKFQKIVQILALLFEKKLYRYELRVSSSERPSTKILKQYLIRLIEPELLQRQDRLFIRKLLAYEDREISYILYKIDKNYLIALEKYVANVGTSGIFEFINEIYHEALHLSSENALKERKIEEIKTFLFKNISLLFKIDNKSALQVFYLLGQTTQRIHDYIFSHHFQRQERLNFLTAVMIQWENVQFQHKQKYMLEHLEQVCMLPQPQMKEYISRFYYPLDAAIKVAHQKGNYVAKALFQTRSGLYEAAFASYQKVIKNTLLINKQQEQTRAKVNCYINQCITLCKQNPTEIFQENLWIKLIKFITSFVASEHQYKVYLKVQLQRSNQTILAEMLRFLNTVLLIECFTSSKIPLPMHKLLPIYSQLYRMIKFDKIIIWRSCAIFKKDLQMLRIVISRENKKAIKLQKLCDFCRLQLIDEQKIVSYSCGHSFHQICHNDLTICLTCSYQSDSCLSTHTHNSVNRIIHKKSQSCLRRQQKSSKKPKERIQINTDIYILSQCQVRLQMGKKKLKLFDYENDQRNFKIYQLTNKEVRIGQLILE